MSKTVIVVPCHNEAERLKPAVFRRFAMETPGLMFLLVNDGSRDGTWRLLESLAAADPGCFSALNLPVNCGKAEAVRRGVLHAAQNESPDFLGFWDADLATPLEAIVEMMAVLNRRPDVNLAIAVRLQLLGRDIRRRRLRSWLGAGFARAASVVLGQRVIDTQCGAKMFRHSTEMLRAFSRPFQSRWIFDVELMARLLQMRRANDRADLRQFVYELPLEQWEEVSGSNLKRSDFFKAVGELAAIWWRYLRPGAPEFTPAEIADERDRSLAAPRRAA